MIRPRADRPTAVVLRALGLGDLLTAVPALRAVRRGLPDHELVLLAPRRFGQLVSAAGLADRIVDTHPWRPIPATLRGAEVAVNLHGRGPESHCLLLASRPQRLIAFAAEGISDGPPWQPGEHEVARWARLVSSCGFPADAAELAIQVTVHPGTAERAGFTVLHPGAASPARRWPPDRWAAVARHASAEGHRVVITGGPEERPLAETVAEQAGLPPSRVLAGRTDLLDLFALVRASRLVLCGDTGISHVAVAVDTPSVVLFGPSSPAEWGPPSNARHRVLWKGRWGDPHAAAPDPGLLAISVAEVLSALDELTGATTSGLEPTPMSA